jgi:hypothetical protein
MEVSKSKWESDTGAAGLKSGLFHNSEITSNAVVGLKNEVLVSY